MTKKSPKNFQEKIAKMNFEEAMARLEVIVETLSSKKVDLDDMIHLHEEGNLLRQYCLKRLDEAKMKIDIIDNKNE